MKRFPVPEINFSNPADQSRHDRMVSLVEQMLSLHKQLASARTATDKEFLQREIANTDRQIDRLVYDLYGLSEEEVKVVENRT
jgi:hypothetical protein